MDIQVFLCKTRTWIQDGIHGSNFYNVFKLCLSHGRDLKVPFFPLKKPIIFRLHCIVSPIFFADSWEGFQFLGVCAWGNLPRSFPSHFFNKRCAMPHCQRYLEEPWRTTFRRVVASHLRCRKCHITAGAAAAFGGEKRAEWQCTFKKVKDLFYVKFCWLVGLLVGWLVFLFVFFKLLVLKFGVLLEPKKRRFWEASFI